MVHLPLYADDAPDASDAGGCGSCEANGGDGARCGNGLEKVYPTTAVRYGYMKHVGEFTYAEHMKFTCGARVVIQTHRGLEIGEQVSLSCNGCDKHVSRDQIRTYVENSGTDTYRLDNGRILREATPDDLNEERRLKEHTRRMRHVAQEFATQTIGPEKMKIVECENLLGGERAIFYFMAEGRVDFRALVKELSREFQTRIQMHQVGARDEARLLADYETCGRQVCCKAFLKTLKPITMRMAKLQRATLDPSKVSGRCGRLKCCLRYEHDSYEELDARLPRKGEKIETAHGFGTVVNRQILTQLVQIQKAHEDGQVTVVIEDVLNRKLDAFPDKPAAEPLPQAVPQPPESRPRRRPPGKRPEAEVAQDSETVKPKSESRRRRSRRRRPSDAQGPTTQGPKEPPGDSSPQRRRRRRRRRGRGQGGGSGDNPPAE